MKADNSRIIIEGPNSLKGKVKISGSKNAVLPILAASLMTDKTCRIRNVPDLSDISTMISVLESLGKKVKRKSSEVVIESCGELEGEAPYDLVRKMRASILVMGPLSGRLSKIKIPLPGGCAIGNRPIDLHLKGMKKLGAKYSVSEGFVNLSARHLKGAVIYLDYPSVGATENLIMAACRAAGKTTIENISKEPEIDELIDFINLMGGDIKRTGATVKVNGGKELGPVDYSVMDDRIQAGTYMIAACIKHSKVDLEFSHPEVLESLTEKIIEIGGRVAVSDTAIRVEAPSYVKNTEIITAPYPGFPTDLQAPLMSLLTISRGVNVISEEVFENRFLHCDDLRRMGASIEIKGPTAIITGKKYLSGAPVTAMDLRGGASLIVAGLIAHGRTEISGLTHIDRGYEKIVENLKSLGAKIWIEQE